MTILGSKYHNLIIYDRWTTLQYRMLLVVIHYYLLLLRLILVTLRVGDLLAGGFVANIPLLHRHINTCRTTAMHPVVISMLCATFISLFYKVGHKL